VGLIKEPLNLDFSTKSQFWTPEELLEFRSSSRLLKQKMLPENSYGPNLLKKLSQPINKIVITF